MSNPPPLRLASLGTSGAGREIALTVIICGIFDEKLLLGIEAAAAA